MTRLRFTPLALALLAVPGVALAQAATTGAAATAPTPQTVTKAMVNARLDADWASLDTNKDGKLTKPEIEARLTVAAAAELKEMTARRDQTFAKFDTNKDGQISKAEFQAGAPIPKAPPANATPVLSRFDSNKDGVITSAEFHAPTLSNFDKIDTNKDGSLTPAEQAKAPEGL